MLKTSRWSQRDLIVVFDAHTQSVDEYRDKYASLKHAAVDNSLHRGTEPLPNVYIKRARKKWGPSSG